MHCVFCKKNGEVEEFYRSHKLKDENDQVICPVLRKYTCPTCQVTGQHTASYCPIKTKKPTPSKQLHHQSLSNHHQHHQTQSSKNSLSQPTISSSIKQQQPPPQERAQPLNVHSGSKHFPSRVSQIELPPFNKSGGGLNYKMLNVLLIAALNLPAPQRYAFFINHDYNPARFEIVRQAAYIAEYLIITERVS